MNPLVKKEIRLLLPGWLAVLALATSLPWLLKNVDVDEVFLSGPVVLFLGMVILAIDSFGREFSPGIFTLLMSQPVERRQIWRTKMTVLFLASALIFAAYFGSCDLRLHEAFTNFQSIWHANLKIISDDFRNAMIASIALLFVAVTGGLWTSLLLRQTAAAFWISLLTPAWLLFAIEFAMSNFFHSVPNIVALTVLYGAAGIYSFAGFWLAHRMFHRAQDAAWTGGIINFSTWRYFESGKRAAVSVHRRRPITALLKKEFQLNSVSLICASALLAVHIAVIMMRKAHGYFDPKSLAGTISEFYWSLWLVMPLVIGCTVVSEERRLGVLEEQFCLPASRRLQFTLKFFSAILFSLLFGALMPFLLEGLAATIGAPNPDFRSVGHHEGSVPFITVASIALGLSLASVFGSTLTKNVLQAMGTGIATIIGCWLFTYGVWNFHPLLGPPNYPPFLAIWISVLTALVVFPWLTYRNFKYFPEGVRMPRRNFFGLAGAALLVLLSSAILYNRAWEVFEPAEPAHGPAKFSLSNPPVILDSSRGNLLVRLPDGRVWFDYFGYQPASDNKRRWLLIHLFRSPRLVSSGPQRFLSGSNWVSAAAGYFYTSIGQPGSQNFVRVFGYLDSVGIKSDGTLWASSKSEQNIWTADKLTRFGDETNWQKVVRCNSPTWVMLLKKDGTLWRWGTTGFNWADWPGKWPGLRSFPFRQIGSTADWSETFSAGGECCARRTDGSVWNVTEFERNGNYELFRETKYDHIATQKLSEINDGYFGAYVRGDGTLWFFYPTRASGERTEHIETFQSGSETNWVSTAVAWGWMVALKSDGTLWKWIRRPQDGLIEDYAAPPTRLGIHNDWVAITDVEDGVVTLAADGSLWFWPNMEDNYYPPPLMKFPKQPQYLGGILAPTR